MANYIGFGRTNYFTVKDVNALQAALDATGSMITIHTESGRADSPNRICLLAADECSNDWTYQTFDDDGDLDDTQDPGTIYGLIVDHLADGETAVFEHIGFEKMRYFRAFAVAVHSDGREVVWNMDNIYTMARSTFGLDELSTATY